MTTLALGGSRLNRLRMHRPRFGCRGHNSNGGAIICAADDIDYQAKLRAEAQAPFRTLRVVLGGAISANASLGALITVPRLISAFVGGPAAPELAETAMNLGIDLAVAGLFAYVVKRDLDAANRQVSRITREERLGALRCELATGKSRSLQDLRGGCRLVIVAGNAEQLSSALAAAQAHREALLERAVTLVFVPLDVRDGAAVAIATQPLSIEDLRWRVVPLRVGDWCMWLHEQLEQSSKGASAGAYLSLRMDGRVRASGLGPPPWTRLVAELPPNTGGWATVLDGMDGPNDVLR